MHVSMGEEEEENVEFYLHIQKCVVYRRKCFPLSLSLSSQCEGLWQSPRVRDILPKNGVSGVLFFCLTFCGGIMEITYL